MAEEQKKPVQAPAKLNEGQKQQMEKIAADKANKQINHTTVRK